MEVTVVYHAYSPLKHNSVEAMEILLMSSIPIIPSDFSFIFKFLQFLYEVEFSITIEKAQVVSLHVENQGFYLKQLITWRILKLKRLEIVHDEAKSIWRWLKVIFL